jgi:type VI secretion system FHA domain protein
MAGEEDFSEDLTSIRRPPAKPPITPAALKAADPDASVPVNNGVPDLDLDLSDVFGELEEQTAVRLPPAADPPPQPEIEEGFSEDMTYVRRPTPAPPATPAAPQVPPPAPAFSASDSLSEEETHYRPALPKPSQAAAPRRSFAPPGGPAADPAVQAFLEGAGLTHLRVTDAEAFMRQSGVMVRAAVEGVMMLLLARQEANTQFGAEPSREAGDNPLKSMADPAEVLAFLFDPNRPPIGDADPVRAFADACSDLRAHQVALVAGMRAAVLSALRTLDPKKIEKDHGVNLGGLNLTRKSKLWDISATQYEALARETEEDFNRVFGREILAAYTAQVHKIRGGR